MNKEKWNKILISLPIDFFVSQFIFPERYLQKDTQDFTKN